MRDHTINLTHILSVVLIAKSWIRSPLCWERQQKQSTHYKGQVLSVKYQRPWSVQGAPESRHSAYRCKERDWVFEIEAWMNMFQPKCISLACCVNKLIASVSSLEIIIVTIPKVRIMRSKLILKYANPWRMLTTGPGTQQILHQCWLFLLTLWLWRTLGVSISDELNDISRSQLVNSRD